MIPRTVGAQGDRMHIFGSRLIRLAALSAALLAAACETVKLPDYQRFADAGVGYADAVPAVLDSAFTEAVRADSGVLRRIREQVPDVAVRSQRLADSTEKLRVRQQQLAKLSEHAQQLRSYFVQLQALASTDADAAVGSRTQAIVDRLTALQPEIAGIELDGRRVGQAAGGVAQLAVAVLRARALEAELKRNGTTIRQAIALQRGALEILAEQTRANAASAQRAEERDRVALPFVRPVELPRDWDWQRLQSLRARPSLDAVLAAEAAARSLDAALAAVARDRPEDFSVEQLVRDVKRLQTLTERAFRR